MLNTQAAVQLHSNEQIVSFNKDNKKLPHAGFIFAKNLVAIVLNVLTLTLIPLFDMLMYLEIVPKTEFLSFV